MTVMSLADAQARLFEVADQVFRTHDRVRVTRDGQEFVVIVAAEELESLEATLELLSDPATMAAVADAEQRIARGEHTRLDDLRVLMDQRRRNGR